MKKIILLLLLILNTNYISAQEWSNPILISTMQGYNDNPDFIIDSNGIIHCVWSHKIEANYRKIYYSKSQDDGETWTEPEDVLQNTSLWMSNPHIATDSENNLYLSYDNNTGDPNNMLVLFRKYNGTNWSEPDTISTNMLGSMQNRIVINKNNRIYVFWYQGHKTYYRFYENNIWSEIFCPYDDENRTFFEQVVIDNENNIHGIGNFHYYGQSNYDDRASYYKYDYNADIWENVLILNNNRSWQGHSISINSNQLPYLTFGEYTSVIPDSIHDATLYTYFNGTNWMPNEIVVEDPKYQTIAIDSYNRPHITNQEKAEIKEKTKAIPSKLVHYFKHRDNWEGHIIDESNHEIGQSKLLHYNQKLFTVYAKCHEVDSNLYVNIFFSKFNVPVSIPENTIINLHTVNLNQNYPNPFQYQTTINFNLNKSGYTTLKILDLQGKLITTLINGYKAKGEYTVKWNGKDKNGKEVTNGLYLYRLQVDRRSMTRSLQLIK